MAINEKIAFNDFSAVDVGGSMVVHTFGAYFGSVAWALSGFAFYAKGVAYSCEYQLLLSFENN